MDVFIATADVYKTVSQLLEKSHYTEFFVITVLIFWTELYWTIKTKPEANIFLITKTKQKQANHTLAG